MKVGDAKKVYCGLLFLILALVPSLTGSYPGIAAV
jgi:hypothetical protein